MRAPLAQITRSAVRLLGALALAFPLALPVAAAVVERPVSGALLRLSDLPQASLLFESQDGQIAAPFADPTNGAALLIGKSSAVGQCRIEIRLDPDLWTPIDGDGSQNDYSYHESSARGDIEVTYATGLLQVAATGPVAACDKTLPQQTPLDAELRIGTERNCAAFGGTVSSNLAGSFEASGAAAPAACLDSDVTLAQLNIYHGHACDPPAPDDGDQCRLADRLDLLVQHIIHAGCPDLVTMQEHIVKLYQQTAPDTFKGPLDNTVRELENRLPTLAASCGFTYEVVFDPEGLSQTPQRGNDEEVILTRYPALEASVTNLYTPTEPFFARHVMYARIDHPIGPLDVYTTHMAAGVDGGGEPCGVQLELIPGFPSPPCPPECDPAGTVRQCQAVQVANLVAATHDVPGPALLTGDFNAEPDEPAYFEFTGRGWIDTYLAVGNPECDATTGVGCTSGRKTDSLSHFEDPTPNVDERIDYAMLIPPTAESSCEARLDPIGDLDGDGTRTRIFADEPNPFAASCGAAPLPVCWASDHEGAEVDLDCVRLPEPGARAQWAALFLATLALLQSRRARVRRRGCSRAPS